MSITTSRRQREKQERRNCIIDAAERVFFRKGVEASTMEEVAVEAELSKGTLYLYFRSKDELFIALSSRVVAQLVEQFEQIADEPGSGIEHVERMMRAYTDFALRHPRHFRTALTWLVAGEPIDTSTPAFARHRELISRIVAALVGAIERGRADGSVRRELDPMETAAQIWGGMLGTLMIRVNGEEMMRRFPHPMDLDEFSSGYIRLVCAGMRGDRATDTSEKESA